MMKFAGLGILLMLVSAARAAPAGYQLAWQDEFKGTSLDQSKWSAARNVRDSAQLSADAIALDQNGLRIRTFTENGTHLTGFLTTTGRYMATYGYFEARIRFHDAPGGHCAFWLQSPLIGKGVGDPQHFGVETDIVEHRATDTKGKDIRNVAAFNLHWDGYGSEHKHAGSEWRAPHSLEDAWHTYAILWTAEQYIVYVDENERWRSSAAVSQTAQEIRLTCEVKDRGWAGAIPAQGFGSSATSPYALEVSWVRVWQKAP